MSFPNLIIYVTLQNGYKSLDSVKSSHSVASIFYHSSPMFFQGFIAESNLVIGGVFIVANLLPIWFAGSLAAMATWVVAYIVLLASQWACLVGEGD